MSTVKETTTKPAEGGETTGGEDKKD